MAGAVVPNIAIGLSLGLGISLLAQERVLKRIFPDTEPAKTPPPPQEKIIQTVDPRIIEEMMNQTKQISQLEAKLANLKDNMREKETAVRGKGNVFELSEVIQANNMASASSHAKQLEEQRQSMIREHLVQVEGEVKRVENKYRPIVNKIRELDAHLESQRQLRQREAPARLLWITCQSLLDHLRSTPQEPLEKNPAFNVLQKFASVDNPLAVKIFNSLPQKALKEGVQSEESLLARFSRLDKVCRRVALVGPEGGGIAKYLVSYLQSLFILDNPVVPEAEVAGQVLVDPTRWNTYDILARVNYCLQTRNLEQAVRYANQLKGQARLVARDWIRDARVHLATRQALSDLSTQSEAICSESYA